MASNPGWPGLKVFTGKEDEPGKVSWGVFSKSLNALLRLRSFLFYSVVFLCSLNTCVCLNTTAWCVGSPLFDSVSGVRPSPGGAVSHRVLHRVAGHHGGPVCCEGW